MRRPHPSARVLRDAARPSLSVPRASPRDPERTIHRPARQSARYPDSPTPATTRQRSRPRPAVGPRRHSQPPSPRHPPSHQRTRALPTHPRHASPQPNGPNPLTVQVPCVCRNTSERHHECRCALLTFTTEPGPNATPPPVASGARTPLRQRAPGPGFPLSPIKELLCPAPCGVTAVLAPISLVSLRRQPHQPDTGRVPLRLPLAQPVDRGRRHHPRLPPPPPPAPRPDRSLSLAITRVNPGSTLPAPTSFYVDPSPISDTHRDPRSPLALHAQIFRRQSACACHRESGSWRRPGPRSSWPTLS